MRSFRQTVVYATDQQFWEHTCVSLYSLLIHNQDMPITACILTERPFEQLVDGAVFFKSVHPDVEVNWLPVGDDYFSDAPTTHITKESYYRLIIGRLMPETADRILYIDGDTIVRRSLRDLFEIDLEGSVLAAIHQPDQPGMTPHIERLGLPERSAYFNAGVLLIDIDEWRARDIEQQCLSYVYEHLSDPDRLKFHDQDTLNVILDGQWKRIDPTWNFSDWTISPGRPVSLRGTNGAGPHIAHFAGPVKPWHGGSLHPCEGEYWRYRMRTPFADRGMQVRASISGVPRRARERTLQVIRGVPLGDSMLRSARAVLKRSERPQQKGAA